MRKIAILHSIYKNAKSDIQSAIQGLTLEQQMYAQRILTILIERIGEAEKKALRFKGSLVISSVMRIGRRTRFQGQQEYINNLIELKKLHISIQHIKQQKDAEQESASLQLKDIYDKNKVQMHDTDVKPTRYARLKDSVKALYHSRQWNKLSKRITSSLEATHEQLELIGEKRDINYAKVVLLGENHLKIEHIKWIADIINSVVKDGDIVLVEGQPYNRRLDKKEDRITKFIKKDIKVYGWDDKLLMDYQRKIDDDLFAIDGINGEMDRAKLLQPDRVPALVAQHDSLLKEFIDISILRNKSLADAIDTRQRQFPNSRIFAIMGWAHLDDPILKDHLDTKHSYIMFKPPGIEKVRLLGKSASVRD